MITGLLLPAEDHRVGEAEDALELALAACGI